MMCWWMRFDDVLRCDVVLPLMILSYEFRYVAGACGFIVCGIKRGLVSPSLYVYSLCAR